MPLVGIRRSSPVEGAGAGAALAGQLVPIGRVQLAAATRAIVLDEHGNPWALVADRLAFDAARAEVYGRYGWPTAGRQDSTRFLLAGQPPDVAADQYGGARLVHGVRVPLPEEVWSTIRDARDQQAIDGLRPSVLLLVDRWARCAFVAGASWPRQIGNFEAEAETIVGAIVLVAGAVLTVFVPPVGGLVLGAGVALLQAGIAALVADSAAARKIASAEGLLALAEESKPSKAAPAAAEELERPQEQPQPQPPPSARSWAVPAAIGFAVVVGLVLATRS